MNQQQKQEWIDALRSGAYEQGQHMLIMGDGKLCCLGVWCVLQGATLYPGDDRCDALNTVPYKFKLAHMNDGIEGPPKTFAEIADWIEANIPVEGA